MSKSISAKVGSSIRGTVPSVVRIMLGAGAAQAITFSSLPFIGRIYSPGVYGSYAVVLAVVALFSVISTLQLNQALVLPACDSHARSLAKASMVSSLLGGAVAGAGFLLVPSVLSNWLLALLVGIAVLAAGWSLIFQGLVIRSKSFGHIGVASSLRALTQSSVQISLGLSSPTEAVLLGGYIAGEVVVIVFLASRTTTLRDNGAFFINVRKMIVCVRRYRDFVGFGTITEALNSVSQGMPVLLLGLYFSQAVAGFYSFAMRVLLAPGQLVANAVRQVLLQHFSRSAKAGPALRTEFYVSTVALALPSLTGAFLVGPFLPDVFALLFGESWRVSGDMGKWLVIWVAFLVTNAPANVVMRVTRKQKQNFFLNASILASRIVALVLSGIYLSALAAVALFALLGVFWNVVSILVAGRYASGKHSQ